MPGPANQVEGEQGICSSKVQRDGDLGARRCGPFVNGWARALTDEVAKGRLFVMRLRATVRSASLVSAGGDVVVEGLSEWVKLRDVPRVDRFAGNCLSGLYESCAKWKFGFPDTKHAWLSHSFVYERLSANVCLREDGLQLAAHLANDGSAHASIRENLEYYYGIQVDVRRFTDFSELIEALADCLERRELAITSFDLAFLHIRREYGRAHLPHALGVVGMQPDRCLFAMDNFGEFTEVPLTDYRACFDYLREHDQSFGISTCSRAERVCERGVGPDELAAVLARCLANLRSAKSTRGLEALRRLANDMQEAAETIAPPFAIPGLWMFSHDRHCFAQSIRQWSEIPVSNPKLMAELRELMLRLYAGWFEVNMHAERSIALREPEAFRRAVVTLRDLIPAEERVVCLFEELHFAVTHT